MDDEIYLLKFADDTKLFVTVDSNVEMKNMQKDLDKNKWLGKWMANGT